MITLAVAGCKGRMGQRIITLALDDKEFQITALLERQDHPEIHTDMHGLKVNSSPEAIKGSDVLIDFTSPTATVEHLKACVRHGVKMVIGTTGLSDDQVRVIEDASKKIAIVFASNMSVGVNILFKTVCDLSARTPELYTTRITEAHHVHKKDAPSGTAKTLGKLIEKNSLHKIENIESIREGEIIGDHKVIFESPFDVITIEHHAKTRDIFAKGALVAAKFLKDKKNGLLTMQDVLNLR